MVILGVLLIFNMKKQRWLVAAIAKGLDKLPLYTGERLDSYFTLPTNYDNAVLTYLTTCFCTAVASITLIFKF